MVRRQLEDRQWTKIEAVLLSLRGAGRPPKDDRNFIEAVLWWRRTGNPLAGSAGRARAAAGGIQPIRPVVEQRQVDKVVSGSAHGRRRRAAQPGQHDKPRSPALGRRKRGAEANAIGRCRGGRTTKVHLVVDALGLPVAFEVTAGHRHDGLSAPSLIAMVVPKCLLGDKAYDVDAIREDLHARNALAVIPPKANRTAPAPFDREQYKARSEVECLRVVVTPTVTVLRVQAERRRAAAMNILGKVSGLLGSDRYSVYDCWPTHRHQFCWAQARKSLEIS